MDVAEMERWEEALSSWRILFLGRPLLLLYYKLETLRDIGNELCNTISKHSRQLTIEEKNSFTSVFGRIKDQGLRGLNSMGGHV